MEAGVEVQQGGAMSTPFSHLSPPPSPLEFACTSWPWLFYVPGSLQECCAGLGTVDSLYQEWSRFFASS